MQISRIRLWDKISLQGADWSPTDDDPRLPADFSESETNAWRRIVRSLVRRAGWRATFARAAVIAARSCAAYERLARLDPSDRDLRSPKCGPRVLPKRVFEIDLEHCPNCGGELKIIAAIVESANRR